VFITNYKSKAELTQMSDELYFLVIFWQRSLFPNDLMDRQYDNLLKHFVSPMTEICRSLEYWSVMHDRDISVRRQKELIAVGANEKELRFM
jgi:hypothetical protein